MWHIATAATCNTTFISSYPSFFIPPGTYFIIKWYKFLKDRHVLPMYQTYCQYCSQFMVHGQHVTLWRRLPIAGKQQQKVIDQTHQLTKRILILWQGRGVQVLYTSTTNALIALLSVEAEVYIGVCVVHCFTNYVYYCRNFRPCQLLFWSDVEQAGHIQQSVGRCLARKKAAVTTISQECLYTVCKGNFDTAIFS